MPNETYEAVHPDQYPIHGGFPYLNLARWYDLDYALVLNESVKFRAFSVISDEAYDKITAINDREYLRSKGVYGPMPYKTV